MAAQAPLERVKVNHERGPSGPTRSAAKKPWALHPQGGLMANPINTPATNSEEWARQCAARRAGDPREWTVAATSSSDRTDDLSGSTIKGGLRQQAEPIEMSGVIGRLRLEASDAMQ